MNKTVIPAKAGISGQGVAGAGAELNLAEIPAFAGTTSIARSPS
ncbi:hypothetical protein [Allosphingosinicella sp.]|jgi:hypothetical protein